MAVWSVHAGSDPASPIAVIQMGTATTVETPSGAVYRMGARVLQIAYESGEAAAVPAEVTPVLADRLETATEVVLIRLDMPDYRGLAAELSTLADDEVLARAMPQARDAYRLTLTQLP